MKSAKLAAAIVCSFAPFAAFGQTSGSLSADLTGTLTSNLNSGTLTCMANVWNLDGNGASGHAEGTVDWYVNVHVSDLSSDFISLTFHYSRSQDRQLNWHMVNSTTTPIGSVTTKATINTTTTTLGPFYQNTGPNSNSAPDLGGPSNSSLYTTIFVSRSQFVPDTHAGGYTAKVFLFTSQTDLSASDTVVSGNRWGKDDGGSAYAAEAIQLFSVTSP